MNNTKNQDGESAGLMDGIASEVSPENAPLLHFITANASLIAGIVLFLLIAIGAWGIWDWYKESAITEARDKLASINRELKGRERDKALMELAEKAPADVKLYIYLSLGQSAFENDLPLSAEAYAKAAELDGDGSVGILAALSAAGSLLHNKEYSKALELLQQFSSKYPDAAKSVQFRQIYAETAIKAGNNQLAFQIYQELANDHSLGQRAYFMARANALTGKDKTSANEAENLKN